MEFEFSVSDVFQSSIVEITHNTFVSNWIEEAEEEEQVYPESENGEKDVCDTKSTEDEEDDKCDPTTTNDDEQAIADALANTDERRMLYERLIKMSIVIDAMGVASAIAQNLKRPITSTEKLKNTDHTIYLLVDRNAICGKGVVVGILKTGKKDLYLVDRKGRQFHQVSPACLLDFYIHESRRRVGLGKQLFQYMLKKENVKPVKLAYDRPSSKMIAFLKKYYGLVDPIHQMNNFIVYDGFFVVPRDAQMGKQKNFSKFSVQSNEQSSPYQTNNTPQNNYTYSMIQMMQNESQCQNNTTDDSQYLCRNTFLHNQSQNIAQVMQQSQRPQTAALNYGMGQMSLNKFPVKENRVVRPQTAINHQNCNGFESNNFHGAGQMMPNQQHAYYNNQAYGTNQPMQYQVPAAPPNGMAWPQQPQYQNHNSVNNKMYQ